MSRTQLGDSETLGHFTTCECGGKLVRVRRRFWQRLLYAGVFRCKKCGEAKVRRNPSMLFSRVSLCPRCGTGKLRLLRKRDPVDTMSSSPISLLQRFLGAELHHCEFCRLQFYDFRKIAGRNEKGGS